MDQSNHPGELPLPESVVGDQEARELARIWASNGKQIVTFPSRSWEDPAAWGILLVDFCKHVAAAYGKEDDTLRKDALLRIRTAFDAEWHCPTDVPVSE